MSRRAGYLHPGCIPDQVVDLLEIDGGWLTCEGIAADLQVNPQSVYQTLFRLRKANRVKSRRRDIRFEWSLS